MEDYIHKYSKENRLLAIRHEFRDCIYQEATTCISSNKDSSLTITKQMDEYRKEGYPEHNGLIASGILFRNHNDKQVIKVMQDWYGQLENYSYRDQLSFNYACYKNNFTYDEAKIFYLKNPYFQRHDHIKNGFALRIADVGYAKDYDLEYMPEQIDDIMDAFSKKTTIIMPITDLSNLKQSIQSILDNTNIGYELMLINDNIKDAEVQKILREYEKYDQITILNNEKSKKMNFPINIKVSPMDKSQEEVLNSLKKHNLVICQSAGGCGKTATAVNIAAHYVACGKRVLIVSKTEKALSVIADRLNALGTKNVICMTAGRKEQNIRLSNELLNVVEKKINLDDTNGSNLIKYLFNRNEKEAVKMLDTAHIKRLKEILSDSEKRRNLITLAKMSLEGKKNKKDRIMQQIDFSVLLDVFPLWCIAADKLNDVLPVIKDSFDLDRKSVV